MLSFPAILKPNAGGYAPNAKSISGGQTLGGFEQVVSSVNDRWQASFRFPLVRPERILAVRAFMLGLRGRANTVGLPVFDLNRPPFSVLPASPIGTVFTATFYEDFPQLKDTPYRYSAIQSLSGSATVTAANGLRLAISSGTIATGVVVDCGGSKQKITTLNDLGGGLFDVYVVPGFSLVPGVRVAPAAVLSSAAAAGASSVSIVAVAGAALMPGHLFSLGSRLYSIVDMQGTGPFVCDIWPGLREAASANDPVNFASPFCEMRLATDGEGADALKQMDMLRFGSVTLNFDEATPSSVLGRELREDGSFELREG
jgi:hypothetical protein